MASDNEKIEFNFLKGIINDATQQVKTMLEEIKSNKSAVAIGQMFEMQMLMNHLTQISEMSSSITSAMNTVVGTMSRGIKS